MKICVYIYICDYIPKVPDPYKIHHHVLNLKRKPQNAFDKSTAASPTATNSLQELATPSKKKESFKEHKTSFQQRRIQTKSPQDPFPEHPQTIRLGQGPSV